MAILRRLLVLAALLFWQGGGAFYGAVAIPIGRSHLGELQSLITRDATRALNWIGVATLAILLGDMVAAADSGCRRLRLSCWLGMALCQAALFDLHARLSEFYESDMAQLFTRSDFRIVHKFYLLASTAQFVLAAAFLAATLRAWQKADSHRVS